MDYEAWKADAILRAVEAQEENRRQERLQELWRGMFFDDSESAAVDAEDVRLSAAERDIFDVLIAAKRRLTFAEIMAALAADGKNPSDGTTKVTLAALVRHGLLTSDQKANPPGYGLGRYIPG